MDPKRRPIILGVIAAVLVVAAVAGAMLMLGRRGGAAAIDEPSKVVVVFALPGEDEVVTAQMVAVVDPAAGSYQVVDTSSTVTLPGTSYSTLRDAYPFGGAEAVAKALDDGALKPGTGWVDVSPAAWAKLVQGGVEVTLTENFDTYDGTTFSEFPVGPQTVKAADFRSFVIGLGYQPAVDRKSAFAAIAARSLNELAASKSEAPAGVTTNLSPAGWASLADALR